MSASIAAGPGFNPCSIAVGLFLGRVTLQTELLVLPGSVSGPSYTTDRTVGTPWVCFGAVLHYRPNCWYSVGLFRGRVTLQTELLVLPGSVSGPSYTTDRTVGTPWGCFGAELHYRPNCWYSLGLFRGRVTLQTELLVLPGSVSGPSYTTDRTVGTPWVCFGAELYQRQNNRHSGGCYAKRLALEDERWHRLARCQYTVTR